MASAVSPIVDVFSGLPEMNRAVAESLVHVAASAITKHGRMTIALAGGDTPQSLYKLLAEEYHDRIPWSRVVVFFGDERCVPADHQESNFHMAREALLDHVPVPPAQVHRIRGEDDPRAAAEEYESRLRDLFPTQTPALDLILLGLGADGHTASLFPGTDLLEKDRRLAMAVLIPQLRSYRITLTLPVINAAKRVYFLVTDESKAAALRHVLEPDSNDPALPAALVRPVSGVVRWFVTRDAASQLSFVIR